MSTVTRPAPQSQRKSKHERRCKISTATGKPCLVIREFLPRGLKIFAYCLEAIPADYGRGFILHKPDGSSYAVNVSGTDSTCDCKGFLRWNTCKHVDSLAALQAAGKLD